MSASLWRVAVTRDEGGEGVLSEALRRHGMEPVPCPVVAEMPPLDPAPLAAAARTLEEYDWMIAASARAVAALMALRAGRLLPRELRTAAVGPSTAQALALSGAVTAVTAATAGAAPLLEILRPLDRWPERRVLLPRAAEGRPEILEALRGWGARVDDVVAYRTVPRPPAEIAAAWRDAAPDAAVVASPVAARALVQALGAAALRRLEPVVAIGSTTSMALVALGVRAVVPPRAAFEAVAALLAGMREARRVGSPS
ncbi:MAG: uroporphyrinogen-III synthase [Candidatus Eisenbacteria bacterium]|uniref:Uroporphyrinogen-III synthase n=1 Tax=Eiseniibacteriota bacterium TaxID=2212470 RepID=A0A538TW32_UNCEI|nr:MAG: uroporphyrinogen-III synthase [Candidatus Eisenbacteria bacterium]